MLVAGSAFTSSVESGGFFGGILAGYVADAAVKRRQKQLQQDPSPRPWNPRMPVALLFMIGVAVSLHLLYFAVDSSSTQLWITCVGFMMGASLYGPIAIFGVVATESAPVALSGTAHAIVALAANSEYSVSRRLPSCKPTRRLQSEPSFRDFRLPPLPSIIPGQPYSSC